MNEEYCYEVTDEQIQKMLFANCCKYNEGVSCPKESRKPRQCSLCGWNPTEAKRRIKRIRKEHYEPNRV